MEKVSEIGNYQVKHGGVKAMLNLSVIERIVEPFPMPCRTYRADFTFSEDKDLLEMYNGPIVMIAYNEDDISKIFYKISNVEDGIEAIFLDKHDPNLNQETRRRILRCINLLEEDFKNKGI
ncbi:MAG: hypothetical protein ABIH25_02455 [Candidatus Woesearchaeota archaeon]